MEAAVQLMSVAEEQTFERAGETSSDRVHVWRDPHAERRHHVSELDALERSLTHVESGMEIQRRTLVNLSQALDIPEGTTTTKSGRVALSSLDLNQDSAKVAG